MVKMKTKDDAIKRGAFAFSIGIEIVAFSSNYLGWQRKYFNIGYIGERDKWRAQCGPDTLSRGPYSILEH